MPLLMPWAWLALAAVTTTLSGTVVDVDGNPVKGATVWLSVPAGFAVDLRELARVETDAEGQFAIDLPADGENPRPLTVWAHAPGTMVAVAFLADPAKSAESPLKLRFGSPLKVSIRILGSDGKPVAGAKVRPSPLIWPASLGKELEAATDAQGWAAIEGVGPGQVSRVAITADGLGTQEHELPREAGKKTVRLDPVGQVSARIVSDDPEALAGWSVTAMARPEAAGGSPWPTSRAGGRSDDNGRVSLGALAAGIVTFRVTPPDGSRYLAATPGQITLRGGERTEVRIPAKRGVKVEGSVREHGSGKPAAGVKVTIHRLSPSFASQEVITDADGRFSLYHVPGKIQLDLIWFRLPDRYYQAPDNTQSAEYDLKAGEDQRTLPQLEVRPAVMVKGTVVDEAGEPAARIPVNGSAWTREFGNRSIPGSTQTDEHGAFVLGRMPPDSTVEVRAQILYRAEASPVTVRVNAEGVQDAPVTLRLVRKPIVSLRGRALGPAGAPVSGARVTITFRTKDGESTYGYGKDEQTLTGPDGTYQTANGVPAADRYRAHVTAEGMEPAVSDWAKAPAVELPDVVMRRAPRLRQVAGRVIDPDGQPVAGAEVFQSGDGPRRTSETTDDEGRFTLDGVWNTTAFVFARREGFRFTGRRIGPDNKSVEIVVSRTDGPLPAALKVVPPSRPLTRAEERAKARALVSPAWRMFVPGRPEAVGLYATGPTLALVDAPRVVELVENQILHAFGPLLGNLALGLYEDDPRSALSALDAHRPPDLAAQALLDLLDNVPDAADTFRRDLLDRALVRAREADDPGRRVALIAQVADHWFEIGEPGKAQPLLDEARAAFKGVSSGATLEIRAALAEPLARVDLPAALALLEGDKSQPTLAEIARRAAAADPEGARRILRRLDQRPVKLGALADVCAAIATKDLPKALDAAGPGAPGVAALAVAVAARSQQSADPAVARALLGESFDRLERVAGKMVVPCVAMARLLPLAVRVDPGRSAAYLWRAIAARSPRGPGVSPGSASPEVRRQYLALAQLAALVARYDRDAAEVVFAPVAESGPALIDDQFHLAPESAAILQAVAAFDPRAALAILDALPDDPEPEARPEPGKPPRFTPRTKADARLVVARALALRPAARLREALRAPNQPDLWPALLDDGTPLPTDTRTSP